MMTRLTTSEWDSFLKSFPNVHLLQTARWGELKSGFGWDVERVALERAGAQILFRRLPLGSSFAYIPKGPVGKGWQALWPEIDRVCRKRHAFFLKVEPDAWESDDRPIEPEAFAGFRPNQRSIQPARTVLIDLSGSEEEILARMKQKTRYNIHLAEKKDVQVHLSDNLDSFYALMQSTGERDGFGVHSLAYYRKTYQLFAGDQTCAILQAEFEGKPLAALMVFALGKRAWYLYGASSDAERNRMPTYLLQWEAMRWARQHGCSEYDLWGIPDYEENELEEHFEQRHDGLWGVYRFKRGFGGQIKRSVSAYDRVYQPLIYKLYQSYMNRRVVAGESAGMGQ